MRSKILLAISAIVLSASLIIGGTLAAFSDYGTSNNNTFTAGRLDLTIDGNENHDLKFNVTNMRPRNQPKGKFVLKNKGSITGYLNISNISVENFENELTHPEILAGDTTTDVGELGSVVHVALFIDKNGDGWISTDDVVFYNGLVNNLPTEFKLNTEMAAGTEITISAIFNWWDTPNDNLAQDDTMKLNFRFDLTQFQK